jgi:hypothetical protein
VGGFVSSPLWVLIKRLTGLTAAVCLPWDTLLRNAALRLLPRERRSIEVISLFFCVRKEDTLWFIDRIEEQYQNDNSTIEGKYELWNTCCMSAWRRVGVGVDNTTQLQLHQ